MQWRPQLREKETTKLNVGLLIIRPATACDVSVQLWFIYSRLIVTKLGIRHGEISLLLSHLFAVHYCFIFYRAMLCIRGTSYGPVSVSVCLSVCLSQVGVLLKRLNIRSHKQHHTIAQGL